MARSTKGGGAGSSKKNRKFGRCRRSPSHINYIAQDRYTKNKLRKLMKHVKKFAEDLQALGFLKRLKAGAA